MKDGEPDITEPNAKEGDHDKEYLGKEDTEIEDEEQACTEYYRS